MSRRIVVAGGCGFVGSSIIKFWREHLPGDTVIAIDNLSRAGSESNRADLSRLGVAFVHADLRAASDVDPLPEADWVIDAAALPSVMSGTLQGVATPRQTVEHNLSSGLNLLEYCRRTGAGFILLSSSRVYAIDGLRALPLRAGATAFTLDASAPLPVGSSERGISEAFSTRPPLSLYGATKLAIEALALEYGSAFGFPVWVNRCGVLAGAGQFGRPDQGIFAFWLNSWLHRRPLSYIGYGGLQVRDSLHPGDLCRLLQRQMAEDAGTTRVFNVSGGLPSAISLLDLSAWCAQRWGPHHVAVSETSRTFDVPWVVLDSTAAAQALGWTPAITRDAILEEIARHAEAHPHWLALSNPS